MRDQIMDEIDVFGIDDILRQAAELRADVSNTAKVETKFSPVGRYNCAVCDEENSLISVWCFKCGHRRGEAVKRKQLLDLDTNPQYNVYNTEQVMEDLSSHPKEAFKPREINMARAKAYGEITTFEYNQKESNTYIEMNEIPSLGSLEDQDKPSPDLTIFKKDDIILYGRGENRKNKKKLYIKPLSTPSLIQNRDLIVPNQLRSSTNTFNISEKTNINKTKPQSRPNSACKNRDNSNKDKLNHVNYKNKPRPRSETGLSNPVFERLYNNAPKTRTVRSSHSSPHLIGKCTGQKPIKTSTVALSALPRPSSPKVEFKSENVEEKMRLFKKVISKPLIQNNYVRPVPLTIHGYKTVLPRRQELRAFYKVTKTEARAQVNWTSLPTEIWLKILRHISHGDLAEFAKTANYFYQITADTSIWKQIDVRRKELSDPDLVNIGMKTPQSLTLTGCDGTRVTSTGLRTMFRYCAESLKVFKMVECSGTDLIGTSLLLHLSARCRNLTHIYLFLCDITDEALVQLAIRANRLENVCIPQCSKITHAAFATLLAQHAPTLNCIDITGCTHISNVASIARCTQLSALYLGNCSQITGGTLFDLAAGCSNLSILDIRGCKHVTTDSIMTLLAANRGIHTLSLSHIPAVTDTLLEHIANTLYRIHVIDLSGCIKLTSAGVKCLIKHPIKALDLGCTAVAYSGCLAIAHYLGSSIEELSFNFCTDINSECVRKIVEKCRKLRKLSIFGCRYIRQSQMLYELNAGLHIDV